MSLICADLVMLNKQSRAILWIYSNDNMIKLSKRSKSQEENGSAFPFLGIILLHNPY